MRSHREGIAVVAIACVAIAAAACQKQSDLRATNPNGLTLSSGTFDAPPPREVSPQSVEDDATGAQPRNDSGVPPP